MPILCIGSVCGFTTQIFTVMWIWDKNMIKMATNKKGTKEVSAFEELDGLSGGLEEFKDTKT